MPRTSFIGVRILWLMLAKKSSSSPDSLHPRLFLFESTPLRTLSLRDLLRNSGRGNYFAALITDEKSPVANPLLLAVGSTYSVNRIDMPRL